MKLQALNSTWVRNGHPTIFSLCFFPFAAAYGELKTLDRIVAIVDDDVVMYSELEEQITALSKQYMRNQNQLPPREEILPQVLDKLIQDRLQLEIGKRAGVKISDAELNAALAETAKNQNLTVDQFIALAHEDGYTLDRLRRQFRTEMIVARVQQGVVNQRIDVTEQEVENFLNSEEGKIMSSPDVNVGHILLRLSATADDEDVKETFEKAESIYRRLSSGEDFRQLALTNSVGPNALKGGDLGWRKAAQLPTLFAQALGKLAPGEASAPLRSDAGIHLLKLYDRRGGDEQMIAQAQVRHILVKPNEIRSDEATRELAESLRQNILAGEEFAALARLHSEDTGSALKGGDLGWSLPGQFVSEFEQAVNQLEIGVVSEPVATKFGWHIIEVTGRRNQNFSAEILRNRATNQLKQRKYAEELQVWLEEIRSEAFIEIKS
jgi:peptidyl-prolyl cis-trans isomerase SurA